MNGWWIHSQSFQEVSYDEVEVYSPRYALDSIDDSEDEDFYRGLDVREKDWYDYIEYLTEHRED